MNRFKEDDNIGCHLTVVKDEPSANKCPVSIVMSRNKADLTNKNVDGVVLGNTLFINNADKI